jgi:hypothetical protein
VVPGRNDNNVVTTKLMKMERDFTGTCREVCTEIKSKNNAGEEPEDKLNPVELPIANCHILLGVTYTNWCSKPTCTKSMFNSYWHS